MPHPRHDSAHQDRVHAQQLLTANLVVGAMAAALVLLGIVLLTIGITPHSEVSWTLALVAAATLLSWVLVLVMPVPTVDPPVQASALMPTLMVRVTLLEFPALLGVMMCFLDPQANLLNYLLPAVFSLLGLYLFGRPSVIIAKMTSVR